MSRAGQQCAGTVFLAHMAVVDYATFLRAVPTTLALRARPITALFSRAFVRTSNVRLYQFRVRSVQSFGRLYWIYDAMSTWARSAHACALALADSPIFSV
jgi:hypothetical protein